MECERVAAGPTVIASHSDKFVGPSSVIATAVFKVCTCSNALSVLQTNRESESQVMSCRCTTCWSTELGDMAHTLWVALGAAKAEYDSVTSQLQRSNTAAISLLMEAKTRLLTVLEVSMQNCAYDVFKDE